MPIRPENRDRYPADWPEISRRIRFTRALGRCECEGECGLRHTGRCTARHNAPNPRTGTKVVLTVAHLDHTPENCDDTNLRAMCQGCHLHYDRDHHAQTAARTRAAAIAEWNDPLPGLEPVADAAGTPMLPTGAIPSRPFMPRKDGLETALLRVPATTAQELDLAAAYVASRARALDWTPEQHEEVLAAIFAPARPVLPQHKRDALANHADQEQP